jgi:glycosyltransferase involved in cell wall biosynthesis
VKKISILNQDSGYLMIDLANAFDEAGYEVSLITGRLVQRNTPLNTSIRLLRVAEYRKTSIFSQFISSVFAFVQMIFLVWLKAKGTHLLIVTNPPFSPLIPFFVRNSYSLLFYDIYIESPAKFLPCRNKSILSLLWVWLHKKSLQHATSIFTLTESMKTHLEAFVHNKKISVVPVWTDINYLKPIPKEENAFVRENNLEDKFIVLYSGTLGISNGLEMLLEVAKKIENPNVQFLIIGEGTGKSSLQKKAKEMILPNVSFLEWQPTEMLPFSLAAADVAVATLPELKEGNSIPSKFFNYLAVGAPILSLAPESSDLANLIIKYDVGRNFPNPHADDLIDFIESMLEDNHRMYYSGQSLKAARDFTKENAQLFIKNLKNN